MDSIKLTFVFISKLSQKSAVYLKDILLSNVKKNENVLTFPAQRGKKCTLHSDMLSSGCARLFLLQNETCDRHAATLGGGVGGGGGTKYDLALLFVKSHVLGKESETRSLGRQNRMKIRENYLESVMQN